ncbi:MAG: Coenzyme F420 hydrogenase/dehydrogenase, beta subunit C-terminal domain [Gemmatimonadota bacterium]
MLSSPAGVRRVSLPVLPDAPHRDLCTDCGVSRSSDPSRCGKACQFIDPRYDELETLVHGRTRDASRPDELYFGPFRAMHRARMTHAVDGAQWSGITTSLAAALLANGSVDAVIATASAPDDRWRPVPALITGAEDMARCRGMKMGYAPLVALVEQAVALGYRRLAFVGVACQVHALRALESEFGLERLYVIGTPCSDNTTTDKFHDFLALLADDPETITYLEFLPDMHVELRFTNGTTRRVPFLLLPISKLPRDFFPLTCRSCFDYTNVLSDVTVGYMAGSGEQWIIERNERGAEMLALLGDTLTVTPLVSSGDRRGPVKAFVSQLARSAGGLPVRRTPRPLRPLVNWMMSRFGPKGLEFARTRVEMKHTEGILNLRHERPHRLRRMVPSFAWALAAPYGLQPQDRELPRTSVRDQRRHTETVA